MKISGGDSEDGVQTKSGDSDGQTLEPIRKGDGRVGDAFMGKFQINALCQVLLKRLNGVKLGRTMLINTTTNALIDVSEIAAASEDFPTFMTEGGDSTNSGFCWRSRSGARLGSQTG